MQDDGRDDIEVCALCCQSTPAHFVLPVIKVMVRSVLTHTHVGTKLFILHGTCHACCAEQIHKFGLMLFALQGMLWLILVCLGGVSRGKIGNKTKVGRNCDTVLHATHGITNLAGRGQQRHHLTYKFPH